LILDCLYIPLSVLNSQLLESVVIATVVVKLLVEEMDDLVAGHVEELSGVGNDDHRTLAVADIVLEPHDSVQVQVVSGFVQQ
jgi:hypothetical protein